MVCSRCCAETRVAAQVAAPPEPASPPVALSEPGPQAPPPAPEPAAAPVEPAPPPAPVQAAAEPAPPPPASEEPLLAQLAAAAQESASTTLKPDFNDSEFLRLEFPATWMDKPVRVERQAEEPPPAAPPPAAPPPAALEPRAEEEEAEPEVTDPEALEPLEQTQPMQVSAELLKSASPPPPDQTQPLQLTPELLRQVLGTEGTQPMQVTPELLRAAMPPAAPPSSAGLPWVEQGEAGSQQHAGAAERLAPVVVLPLTLPAAPAVDEHPSGPLAPVVQFPGGRAEPAPAPLQLPLSAMLGDPFMPPQGYCPKCIAIRRAGALSCPQCGLVFARFKPEEHRPSAPLSAAWKLVLSRWEDKEAHDRLMSLALERDELPDVGRLYRIRLALNPDDPMAWRGRDEVLRLAATATGAFTPSQRVSSASRAKIAVVALLLGVGLTMALLLG